MQKRSEPSKTEIEMLLDIDEGRFSNFFLLSKGQKIVAHRLQERGFILTGERDRRIPMAVTTEGKRQIQRYLLAR